MSDSLESVAAFATRIGWSVRHPTPTTLAVPLLADADLVVQRLEGDEVAIGISGGTWHAHPPLILEGPDGAFLSLDLGALLVAIARGDVVVAEQREGEAVVDRWLTPKGGEASEGLVFRTVPAPAG